MPYRRDPDQTRRRIKEAATRLFARKGYAATSTREIADEAEVTKPALYYYFPNKEGLYVAIFKEALEALADNMDRAVSAAGGPVKRLQNLMREYLNFFAANRDVALVCFQEIFGLGENLVAEVGPWYFKKICSHVNRLVAAGPKGQALSPKDLEYISVSLLGIPNIFILRYLLHGGNFDVEAVLSRITDYYLAEVGDPGMQVTSPEEMFDLR